jgi:transcriptional regulator GlxA family with amidase domain
MRSVAVLALDGVVPFDLSIACEVFGRARLPDGRAAYRVRVCSAGRAVDAGAFELRARFGLRELERASTLVVPGVADPARPLPRAVLAALKTAAKRGRRIASICSGAFVLAEAGLLDGRRATTHWLAASELARRYPNVDVDADVLYVDNGQILTSAGAAAGLDLCLHMIRRDYGARVAADAARLSVMPLERDGGQAQFIVPRAPSSEGEGDGASLAPLLEWLEENPTRTLTLETIARKAAMSTRTLSRRFHEQTGTTPAQWVLKLRVRRAQLLLETTNHSMERIAANAGFGSTATFRDRFRRLAGTSPQAWRRAFRAAPRD